MEYSLNRRTLMIASLTKYSVPSFRANIGLIVNDKTWRIKTLSQLQVQNESKIGKAV